MKAIILFLIISLNSMAGSYIPKSLIGKDTTGRKTYLLKEICENKEAESCIDITGKGNFNYSVIRPEKWLKEQSETCSGEADCLVKFEALECQSDGFEKIRTAENDEVYCTKLRLEHVSEDEVKKADFDAKELKKQNRATKKERGRIARQKCKDALDYVAGGNLDSELTEEQVDAMQVAFADIFQALQSNRPGKALRLIKLVTDPAYEDMKNELIEILE